jgi:hypothetical protein
MTENSLNPKKGRDFQELAAELLASYFNERLELNKEIKIGKPPKGHKFDLVSKNEKIVVECKRYTWTKGDNPPSAKFATLNEAIFYQTFLEDNIKKFIVIAKENLPNSKQTLAEYFYNRFGHLLGKTKLLEIDETTKTIRIISRD